ncbi:hypothetical protein [Haloferula rosea]|uniref:Uncharacterized protein n=1 Tax=Haloferula rosea TaxID=490093 RepID=A0A934VAV0_9BACT|nr:hypothetical protein [Haloferula rosea]MBK1826713.1 hypothetical protein [Haloferula rosea]
MKIRTISMMIPLAAFLSAQEPEPTASNSGGVAVADPDIGASEVRDQDPFADVGHASGYGLDRVPEQRLAEARETLRLRIEVWELNSREMAIRLDQLEGKEAVAAWRRELLPGPARLVHAPVLSLEAKSRSSIESIVEQIYPTEYEPPEVLPAEAIEPLLESDKNGSLSEVIGKLATAATPTAFETRNTGLSVEAEIHPVSVDDGSWDLSLSLEDVQQTGKANYGDEELHLQMPVFTLFRAGGLLRVEAGHWQVLSAATAPRKAEQAESDQSWLVLLRIDPAR